MQPQTPFLPLGGDSAPGRSVTPTQRAVMPMQRAVTPQPQSTAQAFAASPGGYLSLGTPSGATPSASPTFHTPHSMAHGTPIVHGTPSFATAQASPSFRLDAQFGLQQQGGFQATLQQHQGAFRAPIRRQSAGTPLSRVAPDPVIGADVHLAKPPCSPRSVPAPGPTINRMISAQPPSSVPTSLQNDHRCTPSVLAGANSACLAPAKSVSPTQSLQPTFSSPTLLQSLHPQGNANAQCDKVGKNFESDQQQTEIPDQSEAAMDARMIWEAIGQTKPCSVSKLELVNVMQRHAHVAAILLPNVDCSHATSDEKVFEAIRALFERIAGGKSHIRKQDLVVFLSKGDQDERTLAEGKTSEEGAAVRITDMSPDKLRMTLQSWCEGEGSLSKLELINVLKRDPGLAPTMFPRVDHSGILSNEELDAVDEVFEKVADGRRRIDIDSLVQYFCTPVPSKTPRAPVLLRARGDVQRSAQRLLIIDPGFGRKLNPRQSKLVSEAGFQIQWANVPNPETPCFPLEQHLGTIQASIDQYQPHLLACASKGGHYVMALWSKGLWRGPTLMLNAHPSLKELPKDVPIVIAHGSNDDLYPRTRADLEQLVSTGSPNMCFLYTTVNSGKVGGMSTRSGDKHNMDSLLTLDCLPRLMDAALSPPPEMQIMHSWRAFLGSQRLQAEQWLGYQPEDLRRFWTSADRRGLDDHYLHAVAPRSEEFRNVAAVFFDPPKHTPFYHGLNSATWANTGIVGIERVENGLQEAGSAQPYCESLRKSIEDQGLAFEPGLHTRWVFHGTSAIESIVSNPMTGFQPLTSGTRLGSVWGAGTYFARDAKYVVDTNLCREEPNGTRRMLMCLVMTGMSCVGDPEHRGVLPFRQRPHRYHSSVDSLSSPEIFIMQHPSSAYAAYVITFR